MGGLFVDRPPQARVAPPRIPSSTRGGEMDWQPEQYRDRLKLMARRICLGRRFKRFFDSSDLVQETLRKADQHKEGCRAPDEAGRLRWLHGILENAARDE